MSTEPNKDQAKSTRPHLAFYMIVLFAMAFLLLVVSYFMQQRQSDQQVIDGLQQNMSAMQTAQNVIERNQALMEENKALREQLSQLEDQAQSLAAQQKEQEKVTLALDWLWRIEREYFQRRYSSARSMIQEFEASGIHAFLPAEPLTDQDYRTPLEQYQAIRDLLF